MRPTKTIFNEPLSFELRGSKGFCLPGIFPAMNTGLLFPKNFLISEISVSSVAWKTMPLDNPITLAKVNQSFFFMDLFSRADFSSIPLGASTILASSNPNLFINKGKTVRLLEYMPFR